MHFCLKMCKVYANRTYRLIQCLLGAVRYLKTLLKLNINPECYFAFNFMSMIWNVRSLSFFQSVIINFLKIKNKKLQLQWQGERSISGEAHTCAVPLMHRQGCRKFLREAGANCEKKGIQGGEGKSCKRGSLQCSLRIVFFFFKYWHTIKASKIWCTLAC